MIEVNFDIDGGEYHALIKEACARYASFSLVWRDQLKFSPSANSVRTELSKFQISRVHTDQWPGTRLVGHKADVICYTTKAVKTGILTRTTSLFGWLAPSHPEDIAFYRHDGTCGLLTISHERRAIFQDDDWNDFLIPMISCHDQGNRSKQR